DRPERRGVAHLDEDPACRDVARDRERVAVQLAPDHDRKRLIEAGMDALLEHRQGGQGPGGVEDMRQIRQRATLHDKLIGPGLHEVKNLTLSYMAIPSGPGGSAWLDSGRALAGRARRRLSLACGERRRE